MLKVEIKPTKYSNIREIDSLITNNLSYINNDEIFESKDYFSSKEKALAAILPGQVILPKVYQDIFVLPLEDLFSNHFDTVLEAIEKSDPLDKKYQIPFRDYIEAINQRNLGILKKELHGFQIVIDISMQDI